MTDVDFESEHLQLVTDALRAGPGSPQWRAAVAHLEGDGGSAGAAGESAGADEYKLLYAARERLASGRRYREVRPGAGFTRKVFDAIDGAEAESPRGLPSANLIAAVSALAILGILAVVASFVVPRGESGTPAANLAETYFVNTLNQTSLESELGMDWAAFGPLAVDVNHGLRPVLGELPADSSRGGGVFYPRPIAPEQPFAAEASVRIPKPDSNVAVQLFVTDDADFTGDSATTERELVWNAVAGDASVVLPGGRVEVQGLKAPLRTTFNVRLTVNRTESAVEMNGRRLWSGPNGLDAGKPRRVGVRFLARAGGDPAGRPVVESLRLLTPQKP